MITWLKSLIKRLPGIRQIVSERDKLRHLYGLFPPGHYHSPIPSIEEVMQDEDKIFKKVFRAIPGVNLNEYEQLHLLYEFVHYYESIPFQSNKVEGLRYYFDNPAYSYSDAIMLYCMIRHLKPKRIIEVGCGFSSCVILDTNDLFFNGSIDITLIEPYPDTLMALINQDDREKIRILPYRLQDVSVREFETLQANDILFIDSTHVSKINSDVNRIFFDILPNLSSGVYIHFHDVFYPFEYPKEWIYEGRAWNEIYILRAFLQYNCQFRIALMNTFLEYFHEPFFYEKMPLCLRNPGGSIWIYKV